VFSVMNSPNGSVEHGPYQLEKTTA
jgi:hypothetical protein